MTLRPPECAGCPLEPSSPNHDPKQHGDFVPPHCTCGECRNNPAVCKADLLVVGMAPGPEEVRAGQPLVGPAGRKWEAAKSWATQGVGKLIHIKKMNLVQCRTQQPGLTQPIVNRDPTKAEIRE